MRILLCDDSAELRALLRSAIEHGRNPVGAADDVTIVGEVGDGDAALRLAAEHQPDVVVLDLEMPGPAPAALLRTLRRLAPRAAIVTFSGHDPAVVAGAAAREIALHLPKTTDLTAAGRAVRELGRRSAT
ncbi:MAG TPA: response regulator transcription factor [Solirubrobacteraceae bacterium]|nr:response regulator transcription factor [Solirubrobacteraceae bacterium]